MKNVRNGTTPAIISAPYTDPTPRTAALPELFRGDTVVSELVGCHSRCLKGEGLEMLRFHALHKILVGNSQGDVGHSVLPAGLRDECFNPGSGLLIDGLGPEESRTP